MAFAVLSFLLSTVVGLINPLLFPAWTQTSQPFGVVQGWTLATVDPRVGRPSVFVQLVEGTPPTCGQLYSFLVWCLCGIVDIELCLWRYGLVKGGGGRSPAYDDISQGIFDVRNVRVPFGFPWGPLPFLNNTAM